MILGIDVSEHNGDINIKQFDPQFVIVRCGYSATEDAFFKLNIMKCEKLKLPYGIYLYSYALSVDDAVREAKFVNSCLNKCKPTLGIWYDMEDADGYKKRKGFDFSLVPAIVAAFRAHVNFDIHQVGVYTGKNWLGYLGKYDGPLWIAEWGTDDGTVQRDYSGTSNVYMLQFTSKYAGINLDADVLYKNFENCSVIDLMYMVIDTLGGLYGNGEERERRLGCHYKLVQEFINKAVKEGYKL